MAYNILLLSPPILASCVIALTAAAFILNPIRRRPAYVILLMLGAGWNLNVALLFFLSDTQIATFVCKLTHACLLLLISLLYYVLPSRYANWRKDNLFFVATALLLSVLFLLPTDHFISGVREVTYVGFVHHYYGIPGEYYYVFLFYFLLVFSLLIYRLHIQSSSSYPRQLIQRQYLYTFTGLVTLAGVNDLLPYMGVTTYPGTTFSIYPFGSAAALLWGVGLVYAGLRYGLFELDSSLRELRRRFPLLLFLGFILSSTLFLLKTKTYSLAPIFITAVISLLLVLFILYYRAIGNCKPLRTIEELLSRLEPISQDNIPTALEETDVYLTHCINASLISFSSLVPGTKAIIFCLDSTKAFNTAYVMNGRDALMTPVSVSSDIALLPFYPGGKRSQLVLGMDIGITHRNLLRSYFPFIDDRYVWLRHTSNSVDIAVSAFCFSSKRRVLTAYEEVALLLISKQATIAFQRAISLDDAGADFGGSELQVVDLDRSGDPTACGDIDGKKPIGASGPDIVSGAIAHDLRSHITLLGIELRKVRKLCTSGKAFPALSWERIAEDVALLSSLTKELAEYSCASELLNSPETLPLSDLFCLLERRFLRSNDKQIRIYCYKPPQLSVPQRYMEIVLGNLIQNAIDSIGPQKMGSVTLTGRLSMGTLILEVSDNGIGLKGRELDLLFTPNLKAPASDPEKIIAGRTGLGLTIVKHLVNRAGGRIRVQSAYERGTKFTLHFPLQSSQP